MKGEGDNEKKRVGRAGDPRQCFHTVRRQDAKTKGLLHEKLNCFELLYWLQISCENIEM